MKAVTIHATGDIRVEDVPDPVIQFDRDAIVRVVAACVCGSDLWGYRGIGGEVTETSRIGHEFIGVVEQVGSAVASVKPGDFVISPFYICDGTCPNCRNGFTVHCLHGGWWGSDPGDEGSSADGGQGEKIRVPHADGTLFVVPGGVPDEALIPHVLTLSDVMGTGHHAAVSGGVGPGKTVAVVGDGAVGLCAILAAHRLGAGRIVAMSRHEPRQKLAVEFGATDIIAERGDEGVAKLKDMFGGIGPDIVLECVGTKESMATAQNAARPGGKVGTVGHPAGGAEISHSTMFMNNVGVNGGVAPVRGYMAELLPEVLAGTIQPGKVFDLELPLADAAKAYQAMDERRAIKVMLRP